MALSVNYDKRINLPPKTTLTLRREYSFSIDRWDWLGTKKLYKLTKKTFEYFFSSVWVEILFTCGGAWKRFWNFWFVSITKVSNPFKRHCIVKNKKIKEKNNKMSMKIFGTVKSQRPGTWAQNNFRSKDWFMFECRRLPYQKVLLSLLFKKSSLAFKQDGGTPKF